MSVTTWWDNKHNLLFMNCSSCGEKRGIEVSEISGDPPQYNRKISSPHEFNHYCTDYENDNEWWNC